MKILIILVLICFFVQVSVRAEDTPSFQDRMQSANSSIMQGAFVGAVVGGAVGIIGGPVGIINGIAYGMLTGGLSAGLEGCINTKAKNK